MDLDAVQISQLSPLNRNTVNRYLAALRTRMAEFCELESPLKGEVEIDESYFEAKRVKGKGGRGPSGKTIVFGRSRIQVRSATLLHSSSHAHLFEYDGWLLKA